MSWKNILHKANADAQATVQDRLDAKVDPKIAIDEALKVAKEHRNEYAEAVAGIKADLSRRQQRRDQVQREFDRQKVAAKKAKETGDMEKAQRFAQAAISAQEELAHIDEQLPHLVEQEAEAERQLHNFNEAVQEKIRKRRDLMSLADQAKADEALASAQNSMSSLSSTGETERTFDQVEERLQDRAAKASARTQLNAQDPDQLELQDHVDEHNASADAFLADL